MNKRIYISGSIFVVVLILVVLALSRRQPDKSIQEAPAPVGQMSPVKYMKKVCHDSTSPYLEKITTEKGHSLDAYCDCHANWAEQNIAPDKLHTYALTYYDLNLFVSDKHIEKRSNLDSNSRSGSRMINYEKTYGIAPAEVDYQRDYYLKAIKFCDK